MIKKNKLSLFLLAVVMMLSIYYINMPDSTVSAPTVSESVQTKYPEFAEMRLEVLQQREQLIAEFENVLASATQSESEKNAAFISMQEVLELTENEVLVETFIVDLGYIDCFVEVTETKISVCIINFSYSQEEYEEVTQLLTGIFGVEKQISIKPELL